MQQQAMTPATAGGEVSEVIWRRKRTLQRQGVDDQQVLDAVQVIEQRLVARALAAKVPFAAAIAWDAERALAAEQWGRLEALITLMAAGGRRVRLARREAERSLKRELPVRRPRRPQRSACRSFGEGAPPPFVEQLEAIKAAL
jgi:hypothetical protein